MQKGKMPHTYHGINGNIHNIGKYKLNKIADNYGTYKDRIGGSNIYLIDIRTAIILKMMLNLS